MEKTGIASEGHEILKEESIHPKWRVSAHKDDFCMMNHATMDLDSPGLNMLGVASREHRVATQGSRVNLRSRRAGINKSSYSWDDESIKRYRKRYVTS